MRMGRRACAPPRPARRPAHIRRPRPAPSWAFSVHSCGGYAGAMPRLVRCGPGIGSEGVSRCAMADTSVLGETRLQVERLRDEGMVPIWIELGRREYAELLRA